MAQDLLRKLSAKEASKDPSLVRILIDSSPEHVYVKELAKRYLADEREIIRSGQPLVGKEEPGQDEEGNRRKRWWRRPPSCSCEMAASRSGGS